MLRPSALHIDSHVADLCGGYLLDGACCAIFSLKYLFLLLSR